MPDAWKFPWSDALDAQLAKLRDERVRPTLMAKEMNITLRTVYYRLARLGHAAAQQQAAPVVPGLGALLARDPLPAGHPLTWGMITRGTLLEGCRYQCPAP